MLNSAVQQAACCQMMLQPLACLFPDGNHESQLQPNLSEPAAMTKPLLHHIKNKL
jgi:hypothetical protein